MIFEWSVSYKSMGQHNHFENILSFKLYCDCGGTINDKMPVLPKLHATHVVPLFRCMTSPHCILQVYKHDTDQTLHLHGGAIPMMMWSNEIPMMMWSNENIFRIIGPFWGESTSDWWIPLTKANDTELWCFLWSVPDEMVEQTIQTPVIWDIIVPIMTSL